MSQPVALILPTPTALLKLMPTARSRGDIAEVKNQVTHALWAQGQRVTGASVATTLRQLPRPTTKGHGIIFLFQEDFDSLHALAREQEWVNVPLDNIRNTQLRVQQYTVNDTLTVTFVLPPPLREFRSMMSLLEFLNGASLNTRVGFVGQGDDASEGARWVRRATYVSKRSKRHPVDCRVPAHVSEEACGETEMACGQVGGTLLYYYKVFVQKTASVDPDLFRATLAPFALETAGGDGGFVDGLKQMVDVLGSVERCDWWPPASLLFGEHTRVDLPEGVEEDGGGTKRERDESGEEEDGVGGEAKRAK